MKWSSDACSAHQHSSKQLHIGCLLSSVRKVSNFYCDTRSYSVPLYVAQFLQNTFPFSFAPSHFSVPVSVYYSVRTFSFCMTLMSPMCKSHLRLAFLFTTIHSVFKQNAHSFLNAVHQKLYKTFSVWIKSSQLWDRYQQLVNDYEETQLPNITYLLESTNKLNRK